MTIGFGLPLTLVEPVSKITLELNESEARMLELMINTFLDQMEPNADGSGMTQQTALGKYKDRVMFRRLSRKVLHQLRGYWQGSFCVASVCLSMPLQGCLYPFQIILALG